MASISTHILDTARGRPAAGIDVRLYDVKSARTLIASAVSNADGRTDAPLLDDNNIESGRYELEFDVGTYFSDTAEVSDPGFLDTVVIRFGIAGGAHYHVPLLVSPWSYSTYRGS